MRSRRLGERTPGQPPATSTESSGRSGFLLRSAPWVSAAPTASSCCRAQWEISERKQRTRVYRLTPDGRKHLVGQRSRWEQMAPAIGGVLNRAKASES